MAFNGVIPAAKLVEAPFGLFSAAEVTERGPRDEHWGQGFAAMSEACTFDASIVDVCGGIPAVEVFSGSDQRWKQVRPFGILAKDECLSIGFSAEDRRARVIRQLEAVTAKVVERELWAGDYRAAWDTEVGADAIPLGYLAHADTEVVESTAQKPHVALGLLEQAYADCAPGLRATIHVSPLVAEGLGKRLIQHDGKLYTRQGNIVAVGSGYNGSGPGQVVPDNNFTHWMYVTGQTFVVLGSKELITVNEVQATNAVTNEMTYVAERPAAVYTDGCCQFAAQVDVRL